MTDAIFELERKKKDEEKKKRDEERIQQLMMDNNNKWENSGRMNSILRDKFRTKKKEREAKQAENDKIINKYRLGVTQLQEPSEEDNVQAKKVRLDRLSSKDNRKLNELKKATAISTEEEKGKSAASRHLRKLAAQKHNFFT
ncbi:hypothetical protein AX774_g4217 [Zancudomyces culisetae]|uniref:Uncharacterized protein n=1 Tax=Zancudomyces culisetae TaxID=1213189 RepID=A0A1R1PMV9_ZANCU|nr:hypothetical protein AX774_g4826 [Zancudomyces culisetae]OMH82305.1 hypothetical protein AX774_g4217 [Zancudomyces culisetae]|eukprot:OMH81719.1 hypothetical protein AX774_g4826 [Zancudomyces culisetae]